MGLAPLLMRCGGRVPSWVPVIPSLLQVRHGAVRQRPGGLNQADGCAAMGVVTPSGARAWTAFKAGRVFANHRYPFIDVRESQPDLTELVKVESDEAFILHPGEFVLGSTYEHVTRPDDLLSRLEGKSSLGRLGLLVHATAGFVNPGVQQRADAEAVERREPADRDLREDSDLPGRLLQALEPSGAAVRTSAVGKYQGQEGPIASRYQKNFGRP
jgi:dCTP deaminase